MPRPLNLALVRRLPVLAAAALLFAAAAPAASQTAVLQFAPGTAELAPGQAITLEIVLADRPAMAAVGFFDLDIVFDPAVLRFDALTPGSALGDIGSGQAVNASLPPDLPGGVLNLSVLSLLSDLGAQPASPVLGRVSFSAIGLGAGGVGFGFTALETLGGVPIVHQRLDAAVSVVPEPASALFLAAGLAIFAALRLQRRV
jgi:hypothetical protein